MKVKLEFKLQDFWIGAYWENEIEYLVGDRVIRNLHIWICLMPCFPIHIIIKRNVFMEREK